MTLFETHLYLKKKFPDLLVIEGVLNLNEHKAYILLAFENSNRKSCILIKSTRRFKQHEYEAYENQVREEIRYNHSTPLQKSIAGSDNSILCKQVYRVWLKLERSHFTLKIRQKDYQLHKSRIVQAVETCDYVEILALKKQIKTLKLAHCFTQNLNKLCRYGYLLLILVGIQPVSNKTLLTILKTYTSHKLLIKDKKIYIESDGKIYLTTIAPTFRNIRKQLTHKYRQEFGSFNLND